MQYKGKLYGKVAGKYIPLELDSEAVDKLEADRDRWKALAVEAGERLKDSEDYLTESLNNVLDDSRPRYERHRQLIRDDIAENNKVLKKLQEAGE